MERRERARTAPFSHNNLSKTIEEAIDFYSGDEFNASRAEDAQFEFDATQRDQIADFLRALNTLQNIDVALRELQEILDNTKGNPRPETDRRLQTAFEETDDGIRVLNQGAIFPSAVGFLTSARNQISQAQLTNNTNQRRSLCQQAIAELGRARSEVV